MNRIRRDNPCPQRGGYALGILINLGRQVDLPLHLKQFELSNYAQASIILTTDGLPLSSDFPDQSAFRSNPRYSGGYSHPGPS